jgi:hypothetical protein
MKAINLGKIAFGRFNAAEFVSKDNIILFPAGKATKTFLRYNADIKVSFLCDNNEMLVGSRLEGIEVLRPAQIRDLNANCTVIVTSPGLLGALIRQLENYEISDRCEIVLYATYPETVKNFYDVFTFVDRRKGTDKMLLALAGYKPNLWEIVFGRIGKFMPKDIDVCVVTAGKDDDAVRRLCADNGWSYLATATNNCCLAQNIAIELFPGAEWIYKLDEDMFICDGYFDGLYKAYLQAERSAYRVGLVAPLIPVNPHGNVLFLEKMGLIGEYEQRFGKAYYDFKTHFEYNTDETLFLWEHTLPLDRTAERFKQYAGYYVAPHRFSIGAILFKREIWENMGGFTVGGGNGLGQDEQDFAIHFLAQTRFCSYIVAENVLAGHYSFGKMTNKTLLDEFYAEHYADFDIQEV